MYERLASVYNLIDLSALTSLAFTQPLPKMNTAKPHKQSMSEMKLRRLTEHNVRLREDLDRPRVRVSEASSNLIRFTKNTRDYLVPSVWGQLDKKEDPYQPQTKGCTCVAM